MIEMIWMKRYEGSACSAAKAGRILRRGSQVLKGRPVMLKGKIPRAKNLSHSLVQTLLTQQLIVSQSPSLGLPTMIHRMATLPRSCRITVFAPLVCNRFSSVLMQLLSNLILTGSGLCPWLFNYNADDINVFPEPIMGDEPTPAEMMDEEYYLYPDQGMVKSVLGRLGSSL